MRITYTQHLSMSGSLTREMDGFGILSTLLTVCPKLMKAQ